MIRSKIESGNILLPLLIGAIAVTLLAVILMGVFYVGSLWGANRSSDNSPLPAAATQTPWVVQSATITQAPNPSETSQPTSTSGEVMIPSQTSATTENLPATSQPSQTSQVISTATAIPAPTATQTGGGTAPIAANPADWIKLLETSPINGAYFAPKDSFYKTWTVKNIGKTTWTKEYDLVFVSGSLLGDKKVYSLGTTVKPGKTIDLMIPLAAPKTSGTYQGFWMLRNDDGDLFGFGEDADQPLKVKITVLNVDPSNSYDFLLSYCDASWWNSSGEQISCTGVLTDRTGFVVLDSNPVIENGPSDKPILWVHPENKLEGIISGRYPAITVREGDRFKAKVGCISGYSSCNITFKLLYKIGNNPSKTLGTWQELYGGGITTIDVDLSPLAGQNVQFILRAICSNNSPNSAQGFWMTPRIIYIKPTATPTPTLTVTPTATPTSTSTPTETAVPTDTPAP